VQEGGFLPGLLLVEEVEPFAEEEDLLDGLEDGLFEVSHDVVFEDCLEGAQVGERETAAPAVQFVDFLAVEMGTLQVTLSKFSSWRRLKTEGDRSYYASSILMSWPGWREDYFCAIRRPVPVCSGSSRFPRVSQ
jgi:hypothetical protein